MMNQKDLNQITKLNYMKVQEGKLPKMFKRKWVAALRSGEYKQGRGQLMELITRYSETKQKMVPLERRYCCLGVACIIAGLSNKDMGTAGTIREGLAKKGKIPSVIVDNGHTTNKIVDKLTNMNDRIQKSGKTKSFKRIATWIEKYL